MWLIRLRAFEYFAGYNIFTMLMFSEEIRAHFTVRLSIFLHNLSETGSGKFIVFSSFAVPKIVYSKFSFETTT